MALSNLLKIATVVGAALFLTASCEEELETLGTGGTPPFARNDTVFTASAFNKRIAAVQTNPLPLYQLGTFTDPVYGIRKASIVSEVQLSSIDPTFGALSQAEEHNAPENETVKDVYLYIPYQQSPTSVQQGEGVRFDLDSIYGDRITPFTLTVQESTYFLGDPDPENDDQNQEYYSDQDFSDATGKVLFTGKDTISNKEIVIFEEGSSEQVKTRLDPGIRVALDTVFFQQNLLDQEGQPTLQSQANFKNFLRGLYMSIAESDQLMLLLDLTQAHITVTYTYQDQNTEETVAKDFVLNLILNNNGTIEGNAVNTWVDGTATSPIAGDLDTGANASRLYVKGGATLTDIYLFGETEEEATAIINTIKAENWIINEATLVFHVDTDALGNAVAVPPRLYVYNAKTDEPLYNAANEQSTSSNPLGLFTIYDGRLNNTGTQYRVRITEYLKEVIKNTAPAQLALTATANIGITTTQKAIGAEQASFNIPTMATISPLGTVLFGSTEAINDDKKLKLEIRYTEVD